MGKAVKGLGSALGLGRSGKGIGTQIDINKFDVTEELKPGMQQAAGLMQRGGETSQTAGAARTAAIEQMGKAVLGQGPSLAGAQLKQAQDRNLRQQMAQIASSRGGSAAANQRALLQNAARSSREVASESAIERLKERDRFLAAAEQADASQRANVQLQTGLATMPKEMMQQAEMARYNTEAQALQASRARKEQRGMGLLQGAASVFVASDETKKKILESMNGKGEGMSEESGEMGKKKKQRMQAVSNAVATMGGKEKDSNFESGKVVGEAAAKGLSALAGKIFAPVASTSGPAASQIGTVVAQNPMMLSGIGSDKTKKNMKSDSNLRKDLKSFLDKIDPKKYVYKNPEELGATDGVQYGIVAQDLEKSNVGRSLVKDTPNGKMVDTLHGFGAILASQAELNNRLKELEKKRKK